MKLFSKHRIIVVVIECEQALVNAIKELIVLMEVKIAGVMARVWR